MPLFKQIFNEEGLFILLKIYELQNRLYISEVNFVHFPLQLLRGRLGWSLPSKFLFSVPWHLSDSKRYIPGKQGSRDGFLNRISVGNKQGFLLTYN